jgi:hypothetical protein
MKDAAIRQALTRRGAAARELSPTAAQVSAAVSVVRRNRRRPALSLRRGSPIVAIGLCALLGGAGALAATHVLNPGFGAFLDGGDPPGRALSPAEFPDWIGMQQAEPEGKVSVLAQAGSHRLIAYHEDGAILFEFDGHVGFGEGPGELRRELAEEPVILFGPTLSQPSGGLPETTRANLYGFVDGSVAKVRLEYPDGSSELASAATGAFIVPLDLARHPVRLVALDSTGEVVTSIDVSGEMKEELEIVEEEIAQHTPGERKEVREIVEEEKQRTKDSGG